MSRGFSRPNESKLTPSTPNPTHESEDRRLRLGELLTSAGLLTHEQLEECLAIAGVEGKRLGQILVEKGLVSPHSIAMALADQHGGPLKTEYGFATGSRGARSAPPHAGDPPSGPAPLLRLTPMGEAPPSPRLPPPLLAAPAAQAPTLPTAPFPAAPVQPEPIAEAPLTTTAAVLDATLEVENAARAVAELRLTDLLARIAELEAAGARAAEDAAAPLLAQIDELRLRLEAQSADAVSAAEALRAELAGLRARDQTNAADVAAANQQLAAVRDQLAAALADAETLRAQIAAERSTSERAATTVETLRVQLDEMKSRQVAGSAAASAAALVAEEALAEMSDRLANALADAETLRAVIALDHAAREQAEAAAAALRAQLDELEAQDEAESLARSSAEEQLEMTRRELESALAQAATASRALDAQRAANAATTTDELRARVTELETELRKPRISVVPPAHAEVDELRPVIGLQEQALPAEKAREQQRPGAGAEHTRSYSHEAHLLFAPNPDGYNLFERSGPAPAVGSIVELSDGRVCRVLRVGPSPFPDGYEACAYLELA